MVRLRRMGCVAYAQPGSARSGRGRTDLVVCDRGQYLAIETKTLTGRATKKQAQRIREIRQAGGCAYVARTVEEITRGVELWRQGIKPWRDDELDFLDELPMYGEAAPTTVVDAPPAETDEKPKRTRRKIAAPAGEPADGPDPEQQLYRTPNGTLTQQYIPGVTTPVSGGEPDRAETEQPMGRDGLAIYNLAQEVQIVKSMCRQIVSDMESNNTLSQTIVQLLETRLGKHD